jgi:hypothetical protein
LQPINHHHHCQSLRFTKATNKVDQFVNGESFSHLPCGWSKDGLQTFNKMAREVNTNCQEHGEEFDKAFKKSLQQEMASINKYGKSKQNCIDTYNDLNEEASIRRDEESSEEEEQEQWVTKNVFMV